MTAEEIEEQVDEDEIDDDAEAGDEDIDADDRVPPPAAEGEDVESIQDLLVKQEAREEEYDDEAVLTLGREERREPLAVKVVPPQPTEFICQSCYLVKHRSQLKDKNRQLCRDCA